MQPKLATETTKLREDTDDDIDPYASAVEADLEDDEVAMEDEETISTLASQYFITCVLICSDCVLIIGRQLATRSLSCPLIYPHPYIYNMLVLGRGVK